MSEQNNATMNPKLQEFFVTSLQEIYWAENHLVTVLSTMSKAATDPELRDAFTLHSEQTKQQAQRLEQVFSVLNMQPQAEPSIGLQGLFDEGWQAIDETEDGSAVRDVALIVAAQKVEHYEIACYGSLITLAKTIGQHEIAKLLGPTLDEEKETDAVLSSIAESGLNEEAVTQTASAEQSSQATADAQSVHETIREEITGKVLEPENAGASIDQDAGSSTSKNGSGKSGSSKAAKSSSATAAAASESATSMGSAGNESAGGKSKPKKSKAKA